MNREREALPKPVEIKELRTVVGYRLFVKGKTDTQVFNAIKSARIERLNVTTFSPNTFSNGHLIVRVYPGDHRTANGDILGTKKDSVVYVGVPHIKTVDPSDSELEILKTSIRNAIEKRKW